MLTSPTPQPASIPTPAPMPASVASEQAQGWQLIRAAESLLKSLSGGRVLEAPLLRQAMTEAFCCSDAHGGWGWKDAYEAVEAAQVLFLKRYLPAMHVKAKSPADILAMLAKLAALAPTHTKRSEESVALQQFSTPLELAFLVAHAAAITADDVVLEPSAGTGQLAVHADVTGARVVLNELADARARLLSLLFPGAPLTRHNAEAIDDHLAEGFAPSVILMNPPFSASPHVVGSNAGVDLRHLRSALARLAPGGRLVAITSIGLSPDNPKYAAAFRTLEETATLSFTAGLSGDFFKRHGTTMETRLHVFDKTPAGPGSACIHAVCASPEELLKAWSFSPPPRLPVTPTLPPAASPQASAISSRSVTRSAPIASKTQAHGRPSAAGTSASDAVELAYEVIDTPQRTATAVDSLYEPYAPERIIIPGAKPHPDKLVQSAAMASVLPPKPTYRPHLPAGLVESGALSAAQLESIIYAGEAHSKHLAGKWTVNETLDGLAAANDDAANAVQFRRGWFLGDGTGAGKGRQVAGIILDNWLKGRRRAVWISKSESLLEDAQRDWSALGQEKLLVVPLDRYRPGKTIPLEEGILFVTYALLRAESEGKGTRLSQIINWLGRDFDGVIIADEAHEMGNAAGSCTERGQHKASLQGLAGLKLQHALPEARVVYVSATGATTVENLAYAQRLGLWGSDDLPFESRIAFVAAMHEGGIASSEVMARDLKALGLYMARALSYEGVEVDMLEHQLTAEQIAIYDAYADAYQIIHSNLEKAMLAANITAVDETPNPAAKRAARSAFESNKQRFFNHLITAQKMPSLLKAMQATVAAGNAAVVQLVSTSEALLNRRLAELPPAEWADLNFDVTPREYVLDYLKHSFPTTLMESYTDGEGAKRSRPVLDVNGHPIECREAVRLRDNLIENLAALPPVQSALDQIVHTFGVDAVAEITGRSRRIVKKAAPHGMVLTVQNRPAGANLGETDAFMDDKKRILAFSNAGGTGRSYHADLARLNQRRRHHYLLEAGWRADAAIQGLGRTHRTNQAHPPLFRPVATDVRGEKRFLSTISRRLDSLGAITRGERKTGGQGLFRASDNLESVYARDALRHFYRLMINGKVACCSYEKFMDATGLTLTDADGTLKEELPPISTFLNRMLALRIGLQNQLFEVFEELIAARVESAIAAGTFEVGLETIQAESLILLSRRVVATNAASGATTDLLEIKRRDRNQPLIIDQVLSRIGEPGAVLIANTRSNRAALQVPTSSLTLEDGSIEQRVRLIRPMETQALPAAAMAETHWQVCDVATFKRLWNQEVAAVPEFSDSRFHILSGLLLPIWKRLPFDNPRVYRFSTDDGQTIIGRLVPPQCIALFDAADSAPLTADEIWSRVTDGGFVRLAPKMTLRRSLVMGKHRVELQDFEVDALPRLKAMGCYTEIIAWKTRLFVPVGEVGTKVIAELVAKHPVIPMAA